MTRNATRPAKPDLRGAVDAATEVLATAGVPSPRNDAEELAAFVAGVPRMRLLLDGTAARDFTARYEKLVAARAQRVPLQHITGTAAFGPVTLSVGPGVFVPRPETEALLDWAMRRRLPAEPMIVDLCTGSGALALALARHRPDAHVIGVDDSEDALGYARRNVAGTQVDLLRADVTRPGLRPDLDGRVDLLVANPPYLLDGVVLEPEVAQHDPPHALFGGPDGMRVIEAIAGLAARWLRPDGAVAVEHDDSTSGRTVHVLAAGGLADVTAHKDLTGRPRFVTAVRGERP